MNQSQRLKHRHQPEHLLPPMVSVGHGGERIADEDRLEDEQGYRMEGERDPHEGEDSDGEPEDGSILAAVTAERKFEAVGWAGQEWSMGSPSARLLSDCRSSWLIPCR